MIIYNIIIREGVKMKKIFFFDIDGTLLTEEGILPDSTKKSIIALKEQGHEVVLATGRAPYMFKELRKQLDINSYIAFNGQLVTIHNKIIYSQTLEKDELLLVTKTADKHQHPIIYVDNHGMGASVEYNELIEESLKSINIYDSVIFDPTYYKNRNIYQAMLFIEEENEHIYKTKFNNTFNFVRWHPYSIDVDPVEGTKAQGIKKILDYENFSLNQAYAFGDALNDLDMLTLIPNSIAMGNASSLVKKNR